MDVTGKVKKVFDTQTFDSGFRKRELIVTTEEQYPQPIKIEFLQDNIELLNSLKEGDFVKVSINLRGREWTNKEGVTGYFNSIVGWRLEKMVAQDKTAATTELPPKPQVDMGNDNTVDEEMDDLPF